MGVVPDVFQNIALVRGGQTDHLGHIQRRPAAQTNHAISPVRPVRRAARHHLAAGRVAEDARENRHIKAAQMGQELSQ